MCPLQTGALCSMPGLPFYAHVHPWENLHSSWQGLSHFPLVQMLILLPSRFFETKFLLSVSCSKHVKLLPYLLPQPSKGAHAFLAKVVNKEGTQERPCLVLQVPSASSFMMKPLHVQLLYHQYKHQHLGIGILLVNLLLLQLLMLDLLMIILHLLCQMLQLLI